MRETIEPRLMTSAPFLLTRELCRAVGSDTIERSCSPSPPLRRRFDRISPPPVASAGKLSFYPTLPIFHKPHSSGSSSGAARRLTLSSFSDQPNCHFAASKVGLEVALSLVMSMAPCSEHFLLRMFSVPCKDGDLQWVRVPPGNWSLQPEAVGAVRGGNEFH